MIFPFLEEISTVCCDLQSQSFSVVNEADIDFFSGIPLFSSCSNECWQFDFWFLCFFTTQFVHLKVLDPTYCWMVLTLSLLVCEMRAIVWYIEHSLACSSLELKWNLTFSSPVATTEFSRFAGIFFAVLKNIIF